jgi:hypothetical protein
MRLKATDKDFGRQFNIFSAAAKKFLLRSSPGWLTSRKALRNSGPGYQHSARLSAFIPILAVLLSGKFTDLLA